jgi:Leucine-rich repeat (LRR) protein
LDSNVIVSLREELGRLTKLKTLSLKNNYIQVKSTNFSASNPQPIPASVFENTLLIDLNLHGNKLSSTQLNEFEGFEAFLERRKKVKSKNLYGGALVDMSVCGLT